MSYVIVKDILKGDMFKNYIPMEHSLYTILIHILGVLLSQYKVVYI